MTVLSGVDKVQNLSIDVRVYDMEKKWDELYGKEHMEEMNVQDDIIPMVAENKHEYNVEVKSMSKGSQ